MKERDPFREDGPFYQPSMKYPLPYRSGDMYKTIIRYPKIRTSRNRDTFRKNHT